MKSTKLLAFLLATVSTAVLSGCGGGAGSGAPSFVVKAQETVNGIVQNWAGAKINGNAEVGSFSCSGTSCITQFNATTDSNGQYIVTTDALPADWEVSAAADSTCSAAASTGYVYTSSNSNLQLICGNNNTTSNLTISPSTCYKQINTSNNTFTTNCPTSLTITASSAILPISHALTVSGYMDTASALSSANVTATSSTKLVMPFPSAVATNAPTILKVVDPANNQVMGAVLFTYDLTYYSGTGPR